MIRVPFYLVDAFTDTPYTGNPAGVFFDDDGVLSGDEMRRCSGEIARESAFVMPDREGDADFRLRYFTGVTEVPLCGHATIATAATLVHAGRVKAGATIRFATNVGPLTVNVLEGDCPVLATLMQIPQKKCAPLHTADSDAVAAALGFDLENMAAPALPMQFYSTGTPWLVVPVRDRTIVDTVKPGLSTISSVSKRLGVMGIYVFALEEENGSPAVWSRCFAPLAGLNEDPVTGSASAALGWYLSDYGKLAPEQKLIARQGYAGGRGGEAHIVVRIGSDGNVVTVAVTGAATLIAEGTFLQRA